LNPPVPDREFIRETGTSHGMLAVCGGKGGTGKTTTAVGVARTLARRRRRPVVVDADRDMPNLAAVTGVPETGGVTALADGAPAEAAGHPLPGAPAATVIPAHPGASVERALARLPASRQVVVDCPGGAGPDAAAPLRAAERSLLVTTPAREAVEDAVKTAEMARSLSAPPVAVAAVRCSSPPAGLVEAAGAAATAVPTADTPLDDGAVRAAYARLTDRIDSRDRQQSNIHTPR
jgi:septum site-determining protein MinD